MASTIRVRTDLVRLGAGGVTLALGVVALALVTLANLGMAGGLALFALGWALLIGGAALTFTAFREECAACRAPLQTVAAHFPAELRDALVSRDPWALADLGRAPDVAPDAPAVTAVEARVCLRCQNAGRLTVRTLERDPRSGALAASEPGEVIAPSAWALRQFVRIAAGRGALTSA